MKNTTYWSILWSAALVPPQEMVPPDTLVRALLDTTAQCDSDELLTVPAVLAGLTGLAPSSFESCIPLLQGHDTHEHQKSAALLDIQEDCSTTHQVEEFVAYL